MEKLVLDLSQHNGDIDFAKVKKAGYKNVILRLGWLGNHENHTLDTKFEKYYSDARYWGFNIGVYVYSYCQNSAAILNGADWVKRKLIGKYLQLPVFLDLEDSTIKYLGKNELTHHAVVFCTYLKKYGIKNVGIYASLDWFNNLLDINQLLDYKIWLAEWTKKQMHSFKYRVDLWQYTSKGKVNGIIGNVDISKCLCECNKNNNESEEFEMPKTYKNGSTRENVFADVNCSIKIGSLDTYEECKCIGILNEKYIVLYKINNTDNYKVGFVKYNGGIK